MPDLTIIAPLLSNLKSALDIADRLRKIDISIEKAELKLQVAELISALSDTKIEVSKIQEALQEKDKEILRLKDALELKVNLTKKWDAYYEIGGQGQPKGDPYCINCWETEKKAVHLVQGMAAKKYCPSCKNVYDGSYTRTMKPE